MSMKSGKNRGQNNKKGALCMENDYIHFECIHIERTDQNDRDEKAALAYADIDGYTADENADGTVICRVWLLYDTKNSAVRWHHNNEQFIVDWHHNGYRLDNNVREVIKQAKDKLKDFIIKQIKDDLKSVGKEMT